MSNRNVAALSEDQLQDFVLSQLSQNSNSQEVVDILKENAIAGEQFVELTEGDVKELFPKFGHRKLVEKLLDSCKQQVTHVQPPPSVQQDTHGHYYSGQPNQSPPPPPTYDSSLSPLPRIERLTIGPSISPPYESQMIAERQQPAVVLKGSKQLEVGPPAVYRLKQQHIKNNGEHRVASCIIGERASATISRLHKVIVVVGATGSGKSTMINALANYMLGVEFRDPHRYQLITQSDEGGHTQAHSQTSWVKSYTFPKQPGSSVPYTLTIVDTPGYGDTRGVDRDISITQQIKFFLECKKIGVDHINAIAFVVKASDARLTKAQMYIFQSILGLFAKDIEPGMMIVATHADGKEIRAREALITAGVPVKEELLFAVNNAALYAANVQGKENDDDYVEQNSITWRRNKRVFESMCEVVGKMDSISLWQTKENLKERDRLRIILESIEPQIQEGVTNAQSIVELSAVVKRFQGEIDKNKDFEIAATITVSKTELVSLKPSEKAFNCVKCKVTCHHPCITPVNRLCNVMATWNNQCSVCPKACIAADHKKQDFKYERRTVKEKQVLTEEQLEKQFNYRCAEQGKTRSSEALKALLERQVLILLQNLILLRKAKQCLKKIQEISLTSDSALGEDYIDMMILNEEAERKEGWEKRVKSLSHLKHVAKLTNKIDNLDESNLADVLKELGMDPLDLLQSVEE